MTRSFSYRIEQPSTATPVAVYDTLIDVERWPDWVPSLVAASWERRGAPDTGEGGIRRTRSRMLGVPLTLREEILGGTRPHHHSYNLLSNALGINNYRQRSHRRAARRLSNHLDGNIFITYPRPRKAPSDLHAFTHQATSGSASARGAASWSLGTGWGVGAVPGQSPRSADTSSAKAAREGSWWVQSREQRVTQRAAHRRRGSDTRWRGRLPTFSRCRWPRCPCPEADGLWRHRRRRPSVGVRSV